MSREIPSQYTRMMIVEAISDRHTADICNILDAHIADAGANLPGFITSQRLSEEGGRMVVFEVTFDTREHLLQYHAGRVHRQMVQAINHLLIGDPVVKVFKRYSYTEVMA